MTVIKSGDMCCIWISRVTLRYLPRQFRDACPLTIAWSDALFVWPIIVDASEKIPTSSFSWVRFRMGLEKIPDGIVGVEAACGLTEDECGQGAFSAWPDVSVAFNGC